MRLHISEAHLVVEQDPRMGCGDVPVKVLRNHALIASQNFGDRHIEAQETDNAVHHHLV